MGVITSISNVSPIGSIATLTPTFQITVAVDVALVGDETFGYSLKVWRVSTGQEVWQINANNNSVPAGTNNFTFNVIYGGPALISQEEYEYGIVTLSLTTYGSGGSSPTQFTPNVNTAPVATVTSPTGATQVGTLTPSLVMAFSDIDSSTNGQFSAYQIKVRRVSDQVSFWTPAAVSTSAAEKTARAATKVYAGTTLVNTIPYEWAVRVQDGGGLWSPYTAWAQFTPMAIPNPPSSLAPSGLTNTLTPTISGVYNQATGGTQVGFQYEIRQGTTAVYASGDVAVAIATGQVYGTNNAGDTPSSPPALEWGTSYQVRARSKDNAGAYSAWSDWVSFNTNAPPTTPTNLSPSANAITGDTTPDLSWTHNDPDSDAQTAVEIEMYDITAAAFVTNYNPKALSQSTLIHTTATALTLTHSYRWRIRTKALAAAGFGPWSDNVFFAVANGPTLTVTEVDPDDVLAASGYTATWTFSGGSGTQQDYRVQVYADDQTTVVYDSGVVASAAVSAAVPPGYLINGEQYYQKVTVRDTLNQSAVSSLIPFTTNFTRPATITGIAAAPIGGTS